MNRAVVARLRFCGESGARRHRGDASAAWQEPLEYSFDGTSRWRFGEFSAAHLVRQ